MARYLLLISILLSAVCSGAEQFVITERDGTTHGPFSLTDGTEILLGEFEGRVSIVDTARDRVLNAIQSIQIPKIDFVNADIHDVVGFLQNAVTEYGKKLEPPLPTLALSLTSPADQVEDPEDPSANPRPAAEALEQGSESAIPRITFSARYVTLYEVLRIITDIADLKYRIEGNCIFIVSGNAPDGELITQRYSVLPTLRQRIFEILPLAKDEDTKAANVKDPFTSEHNHWKRFFGELGVEWPVGSHIHYVAPIGKLIMTNTLENHEILEQILGETGCIAHQVEIRLDIVAFAREDINRLAIKGVEASDLLKLWETGKAELLASPGIITKSGYEATVKGVEEYIYPTELNVQWPTEEGSERNRLPLAVPASFETREVGAILSVLPEVSPEGRMLNLEIRPEWVDKPTWHDYLVETTGQGDVVAKAMTSQPFFPSSSLQTSVLISNGERILLGGGAPMRDSNRLAYMFVMARLVDTAGRPVPLRRQKW